MNAKPGQILSALELLAAAAYDAGSPAVKRTEAAKRWFDLTGRLHARPFDRMPTQILQAHYQLHAPFVAQVLLRVYGEPYGEPRQIPPDEWLPAWTTTGPEGWRPGRRDAEVS